MTTHLLVMNDALDLLDLFKEILEEEGFRVTTRALPVTDIDEVVQLQPDLIILDYLFGSEPLGMTMLEQLQLDPRTAPVPVIVASAALQLVREVAPELERRGVAVLYKPFQLQELLETIQRALSTTAADAA